MAAWGKDMEADGNVRLLQALMLWQPGAKIWKQMAR